MAFWVCALAFTAGQSAAQVVDNDDLRYTFAFLGTTVQRALEVVTDEIRIDLIFSSELVEGRKTFCRISNGTTEEVLSCVLEKSGLDFVRLSTGTYVVVESNRTSPLYSQMFGRVVDASTGTPLPDASVQLLGPGNGLLTGTATNRDGRFVFAKLTPGPHRLVVSHIAYFVATDSIIVGPHADPMIGIEMEPRVVFASPVVVSGFETRRPSDYLGRPSLDAAEIDKSSGLGLNGIMGDISAIEGVRLGDAFSDVHVQGGSSSEQLFLLDGVPVFVPVANGGFISPFSPFALERITVRKAGFGAEHGSTLSGVIEVDQRSAPSNGEHVTLQIDPISANGRWAGQTRLKSGSRGSWMIAARTSLWDLYHPERLESLFRNWSSLDRFLVNNLTSDSLARDLPFVNADDYKIAANYTDVHAAGQLSFGGLRSMQFSFYDGRNDFGIEDLVTDGAGGRKEDVFEDAYRWRNRAGRLRYEWVQSNRLFANVEAWFSSYRLQHPTTISLSNGFSRDTTTVIRDFNNISKGGIRVGGDVAASGQHLIKIGTEATLTESGFALSLSPDGSVPFGPESIAPVRWALSAFVQDQFTLSPALILEPGVRATLLPESERAFVEPRVSLQHDREVGKGGAIAARVAVGIYRQFLHSVDVATYNVTSLVPRVRFWLPIGRDQSPPFAYHTTASFAYRPQRPIELAIEGYYKYQPKGLVLDYGAAASAAIADQPLIHSCGYAYGASTTIRYQTQRVNASLQYDYSVARQRIPNRFDGRYVPVPWDVPNRASVALDLAIANGIAASVRWQGMFGRVWGFRQAYYDFLEPTSQTSSFGAFDLSRPEDHRLPAFHQLDLGASANFIVSSADVQVRVMLVNALGRDNVTDWSLLPVGTSGQYMTTPRLASSFLPSVSLRVTPW